MSIESLLSRVSGLKKTSAVTWLCRCPSHEDRSPSLSLRQADDGRILVHCFAGCSTDDVLGAVGLTMDDLFEQPLYHKAKPIRGTKVFPRDVLEALRTELMIVAITAFELRKGKALSEVDQARLELAYERFTNAVELAGMG